MADNRKYYYLKLKENFFDSDSIVLLEDMKDGILYSNILLKLYLKSLKNGGKLQLEVVIFAVICHRRCPPLVSNAWSNTGGRG